jgi:CBS domain-containing protein
MRVDSVMTRDIVSCEPTDTLAHAAKLMAERDCGCVPVCERGGVVGILTDRDVCLAAVQRDQKLRDISVQDVMTRDVMTCMPSDSVDAALLKMRQRRVRRLPVTHSGKLIGVLSLNDVALIVTASQPPGEGVSSEQIAHALADVSAHRIPVRVGQEQEVPRTSH